MCNGVQHLVNALNASDTTAASVAIDEIRTASHGSTDSVLALNGLKLTDVTRSAPLDQAAFVSLVNQCGRLGLSVTGLNK
jgi:hypothetical protein